MYFYHSPFTTNSIKVLTVTEMTIKKAIIKIIMPRICQNISILICTLQNYREICKGFIKTNSKDVKIL